MIVSLAEKVEPIFQMLARTSLQAALLAAIVGMICLLLARRMPARWICLLWLVVATRFLLPIVPESSWSIFHWTWWEAADSIVATVQVDIPSSQPVALPIVEQVVPETTAATPLPIATVADTPSVRTPISIWQIASLIWAAGVILLLARSFLSALRLRRFLASCKQVTDSDVLSLLGECCREMGLKRSVCLKVSESGGPALAGLWRPTIVLPRHSIEALATENLRYVLLHELAHVRRRDVWTQYVARLATAVHWPNPIVWLVARTIRFQQELASDQLVILRVGPARREAYGRVLLSVVESITAQRPVVGAVPLFSSGTRLKRRIVMIKSYKRPSRWWVPTTCLLIGTLAMIGFTDAAADEKQQAVKETEQAAGPEFEKGNYVIAGTCVDEDGEPVDGVNIYVFEDFDGVGPRRQIATTVCGEKGAFQIENLPEAFYDVDTKAYRYLLVVAMKKGHATKCRRLPSRLFNSTGLGFILEPAVTLRGRVVDRSGKPVKGAAVAVTQVLNYYTVPYEGMPVSRTDADGWFEMDDVRQWEPRKVVITKIDEFTQTRGIKGGLPRLSVSHPTMTAVSVLQNEKLPRFADVVLEPAAVIEGRVWDSVTSKPAANVKVMIQAVSGSTIKGTKQHSWTADPWAGRAQRTDENGKYRFPTAQPGVYNIVVESPNRTAIALGSVLVKSGEKREVPDLQLIEGSFIVGHVVDTKTGLPVVFETNGNRITIGLHGPSRPKTSAMVDSATVDDTGAYRLRVPPGKNYPYIMSGLSSIGREELLKNGIDIEAGEPTTLDFLIP